MAFSEPIFAKVKHVQRRYIETFYTEYHQNQFVNTEGRVEILPYTQ